MDPRIQVGRAGAPGSRLRQGRRGGRHLHPPRRSHVCGPGWGWWRRGSRGKKRGSGYLISLGSWGGCSARVDAAGIYCGVDLGQNPGVAAACPAVGRMCNKGKKGAGRVPQLGSPRRRRCTASWRWEEGSAARGGRFSPLQRGLAPVPWVPSLHLAEVPRLSHLHPPLIHCYRTEAFL